MRQKRVRINSKFRKVDCFRTMRRWRRPLLTARRAVDHQNRSSVHLPPGGFCPPCCCCCCCSLSCGRSAEPAGCALPAPGSLEPGMTLKPSTSPAESKTHLCWAFFVGSQQDATRVCCWVPAPAARRPQLSFAISSPHGAQQQTRRLPLHAGNKTLHQNNPPVLDRKTVIVVVVPVTFL